MLHTARSANEPFYLEYSHLPDYTGGGEKGSGHATVPSRVRVALDGRGQWTCTVLRRIGWLPMGETAAAFARRHGQIRFAETVERHVAAAAAEPA